MTFNSDKVAENPFLWLQKRIRPKRFLLFHFSSFFWKKPVVLAEKLGNSVSSLLLISLPPSLPIRREGHFLRAYPQESLTFHAKEKKFDTLPAETFCSLLRYPVQHPGFCSGEYLFVEAVRKRTTTTPDRSPLNASHATSYSRDLSWENKCPETLTKWRKIRSSAYRKGFVETIFLFPFSSFFLQAEADSIGGKLGSQQPVSFLSSRVSLLDGEGHFLRAYTGVFLPFSCRQRTTMNPYRSPPNAAHETSYSRDLSWEDKCPGTLTKWRKIRSSGYRKDSSKRFPFSLLFFLLQQKPILLAGKLGTSGIADFPCTKEEKSSILYPAETFFGLLGYSVPRLGFFLEDIFWK
ncbi:hypothetical protein CEXT_238151 [Caerostris extrusa]|uniref:Uncharacterized protein n=1 Tax=Caerostris extrusa TaxID=172846 RepID=A0AAV4RIT5_CAEEX|nr:hypothetical protein CEXT_238151 [Caerostris extrusa]